MLILVSAAADPVECYLLVLFAKRRGDQALTVGSTAGVEARRRWLISELANIAARVLEEGAQVSLASGHLFR